MRRWALSVKGLGLRLSTAGPGPAWTLERVEFYSARSEGGKERKNITLSKEGRKYSILSSEYGRLRARGPRATSSPRSTLTVRGGWTRHRTGSRCRCMARASGCSTLTPPEYKTPTEDWVTDSAMQCGSTRADREGEIWIGYSTSGANHETAPVSSSKCHGRITLFVRESFTSLDQTKAGGIATEQD